MANLIDISDFEGIKRINPNQKQDRQLDPFITEAQDFDSKELFGASFWQDIITNFGTPDNEALLDGAVYDNDQGDPVAFRGIKDMLVYFSYARYVGGKNIQDTPFGFVNKRGEKSDQIDSQGINREGKRAVAAAFSIWNEIRDFLNSNVNNDKYPLWRKDCERTSRQSSPRITRMGRDRLHGHHRHDDHSQIGHDHNITH